MNDSDAREALDAKHDRNREQRIEGIKRWVEYIETHDPSEWGDQQNQLVDSQLESARQSGIDADHRRRVEDIERNQSA